MQERVPSPAGALPRVLPPPHVDYGRLVEEMIVPRLLAGDVEIVLSDRAVPLPERRPGSADRIPARYLVPRDSHPVYEVCWVVEGRCELWVARRTVALDSRRACIVRPGEAHQLRPTPSLDGFRTLWWYFAASGIGHIAGEFAPPRRGATHRFVALDAPATPLLERVVRELQVQRPHYQLFVRTTLLEIAARILRGLAESPAAERLVVSQARPVHLAVQRLIEHVQAQHGAGVTLGSLAALVGLSPKYVTALFHRQTGRTLMAYVAEVRHREALSLLRNTDLHVALVAQMVGYEDAYYFGRRFKEREGCTPLQYRRLFRAPASVGDQRVRPPVGSEFVANPEP